MHPFVVELEIGNPWIYDQCRWHGCMAEPGIPLLFRMFMVSRRKIHIQWPGYTFYLVDSSNIAGNIILTGETG
jgi:hypothetical protein